MNRNFVAYYAGLSPERKAVLIARATARNRANPQRRREISRLSAQRRSAAMDPAERREKRRIESARRQEAIRAWQKDNPDRVAEAQRRYREANPFPSLPEERKLLYLARAAARRAVVAQATPAWADHDRTIAVYREARYLTAETGVPHEVDHIVPLNSPIVCGLHVHHNLRVVHQKVNRAKRNHLEVIL